MSVPFLHKFRSRSQAATAASSPFAVTSHDWPLSLIGPEGAQLVKFSILGIGEAAPRKAGIFIYAKRGADRQWQSLYIGETGNLQARLAFNEIAADALLSGATDIHILTLDADAGTRRDLCEKFVFTNRPPLNEEARTRARTQSATQQKPARRRSNAA